MLGSLGPRPGIYSRTLCELLTKPGLLKTAWIDMPSLIFMTGFIRLAEG